MPGRTPARRARPARGLPGAAHCCAPRPGSAARRPPAPPAPRPPALHAVVTQKVIPCCAMVRHSNAMRSKATLWARINGQAAASAGSAAPPARHAAGALRGSFQKAACCCLATPSTTRQLHALSPPKKLRPCKLSVCLSTGSQKAALREQGLFTRAVWSGPHQAAAAACPG